MLEFGGYPGLKLRELLQRKRGYGDRLLLAGLRHRDFAESEIVLVIRGSCESGAVRVDRKMLQL